MLETIFAEIPRRGSGTVAVLTVAVEEALAEAGAIEDGAAAGGTSAAEGVGTEAAVTAGLGVLKGVATAVGEVATDATDPSLAVASGT